MLKRVMVAVFAGAFGACTGDLGTGPTTEFNGIKYTAVVNDIVTTQNDPNLPNERQFSVTVTLTNKTGDVQTRTYPASCAVRLRLYRTGDGALIYDETRRVCDETPTVTMTIDGFGTKTLQSGIRFPRTVTGDSLPTTDVRVRAVVATEGSTLVSIDAGTTSLCPVQGCKANQ